MNSPNENDLKPIHLAAQSGQVEAVRTLVRLGADASALGKNSRQPVHLAATNGHTETIRCLVDFGASISASAKNGWQPLHQASKEGYLDTVKCLIALGADVNQGNKFGNQSIHFAAEEERIEIIKYLVESGASVTAENNNGRQPIHNAGYGGKIESIKCLLEMGVDIETKDMTGSKSITYAAHNNHFQTVKYLINIGANLDGLHLALHSNTERVLEFIKTEFEESPDKIRKFFGQNQNSFICFQKDGRTFLQSVLDRGLVKEKSDLLALLKDIQKEREEVENLEQSIIEQLKFASNTTPGLVSCIKDTQDTFQWTSTKSRVVWILKVTLLIVSMVTYFLDIYTDAIFARDLFNSSLTNFTTLSERDCKLFLEDIDQVCRQQIPSQTMPDFKNSTITLLKLVQDAEGTGQTCIEENNRFENDPKSWKHAGIVTVLHILLPFCFASLVWIVLSCKKGFSFLNLPLPPVTKLRRSILEYKYCENETRDREEELWNVEKKTMYNVYEDEKLKIMEKMEQNEHLENISIMIESAMEATFQVRIA